MAKDNIKDIIDLYKHFLRCTPFGENRKYWCFTRSPKSELGELKKQGILKEEDFVTPSSQSYLYEYRNDMPQLIHWANRGSPYYYDPDHLGKIMGYINDNIPSEVLLIAEVRKDKNFSSYRKEQIAFDRYVTEKVLFYWSKSWEVLKGYIDYEKSITMVFYKHPHDIDNIERLEPTDEIVYHPMRIVRK